MDEILSETERKMEAAIENMEKRFANVRAGRANPAILDGIVVSYYGTDTPLKSLATISIPEARQLIIKPFDKSATAEIERAIFEANIGLTPNNLGDHIVLNIHYKQVDILFGKYINQLIQLSRLLLLHDLIVKFQRF